MLTSRSRWIRRVNRFQGVAVGYYMRFFDTSDELLSVHDIEIGLKENGCDCSHWIFPRMEQELWHSLCRGDDLFAEIEINGYYDDNGLILEEGW